MKDRLQQILDYKTGGKQTPFAKMLGWTPQYLAKLLRGDNFGIQPVITLLSTFPEINARWLLLGDGQMLSADTYTGIRQEMYAHIQGVLELEKYLPYMEPDELHEFEQAVIKGRMPVFSPDTVAKWQERASERENELNVKFAAASGKSDMICNQKRVQK